MSKQLDLLMPQDTANATAPTEPFPVLDDRYKVMGFDTEGTGINKHTDRACGMSLSLEDGRDFYLPWGHLGGGNYDREKVRLWARNELRDKTLIGLNVGFDAEMLRHFGVDLEAQGCALVDVGHRAALLDEYRYSGFNLDSLGKEYAGRGKQPCPIPPASIHRTAGNIVSSYAKWDSSLALDVFDQQQPQIVAQGLEAVNALESQLIWTVNEMERNGVRIDLEKLDRWRKEVRSEVEAKTLNLYHTTGLRVNPSSPHDMIKLFKRLGLDYVNSKSDTLRNIHHPAIREAFQIRQLKSLLSKYLDRYWELSAGTGILRYSLHQLRAYEGGTITGRFSSSGGREGTGINCQQVQKPEKQIRRQGFEKWVIRELFLPRPGRVWFSSDAKQIEFRLFGHYAANKMMLDAYGRDPNTDFYAYVVGMLRDVAGYTITREDSKVLNLANIYGQGKDKRREGLGVDEETLELIDTAYDRAFPEARRLMRKTSSLAQSRGWVKTLLGRRGRYDEEHTDYYTALNKILQGSAADIMKMKLLAAYRERKTLDINIDLTVHDELDGDIDPDPKKLALFDNFMQEQMVKTKVPILWDSGYGVNWKEAMA